jgi:transposase-like protein
VNYIEFQDKFPTEQAIIDHFTCIRYPDGVACNHCGSFEVRKRADKSKVYQCADCSNDFSIFKDTMFEDTYTDLRKWMYALHLFLNGKKGIAALQLQREIGGSYKTSWRMLHKIRQAMGNKGNIAKDFRAIIEIDETYVGGKPRKGNNKQHVNENGEPVKLKRGRGTNKVPVVGMICRATNQVHAKIALPNKEGKKLSGKQLKQITDEVIHRRAIIMTDEFRGYNYLSGLGHAHFRIDHRTEYARGSIHTNTIESFWAILKRGIYGIYHNVSNKYLQRYINEFSFRYNHRKEPKVMFDLVLSQGIYG